MVIGRRPRHATQVVVLGSAVVVLASACGDSRADDGGRRTAVPVSTDSPVASSSTTSTSTSTSSTSSSTSTSTSTSSTTSRTTVGTDAGTVTVELVDGVVRVVDRRLDPGWVLHTDEQSATRLSLVLVTDGAQTHRRVEVEVEVVGGALRTSTHSTAISD